MLKMIRRKRKWKIHFLEENACDVVITGVFGAQSNILNGQTFLQN